MRLLLENIGKISSADIELDGITVIAGENDTGKSTIGKTLYTIFNSFYDLDEQIMAVRCEMIENIVGKILWQDRLAVMPMEEFAREITDRNAKLSKIDIDYFKERLQYYLLSQDVSDNGSVSITDASLMKIFDSINQILDVNKEEIFKKIFQNRVNGEFSKQLTTISTEEMKSNIRLDINGNNIEISLENQDVVGILNPLSLKTQAIYIDDPLIMDRIASAAESYRRTLKKNMINMSHREHLRNCLMTDEQRNEVEYVIDEMIIDKQMKELEKKINEACEGDFRKNRYYEDKKRNGIMVDIHNVSAGIKIFMVIKQLLKNKVLGEKGTLILDEPEVYLHPKWQLLFAEIIVLLQKKYNMHILLTTHSPYFLRAIEVYAGSHEIADRCNYYLAEKHGVLATLSNVTNNTEDIYRKLLEPFEALQMETYQNDTAGRL